MMGFFRKSRKKEKDKTMNVQIRTAYGEMSFDMAQDKVLSLIGLVITYAKGEEPTERPEAYRERLERVAFNLSDPAEPEPPRADTEQKPTTALAAASGLAEKSMPDSKTNSRLERMFGARDGWNMPAEAKQTNEAEQQEEPRKEWRGFLYIECEDCGQVKGFCAKHDMRFYRCQCGHDTWLNDQRAVHERCSKCGKSYTYKTNKREERFTMDCLNCGAPVDMELGKRGTAYVTADEIDGGERS